MSTGRYFIIRSRLNDLVLAVDTGGAKVFTQKHRLTWPSNQLWFEEHVTGTIRSKFNGYCLDTSKFLLQLAPYNGCTGQNLVVNGQVVARREDISKVLDIIKENKAEGAEICLYTRNRQSNQHWTFEYGPPQYFTVSTMASGELLTAGGSAAGDRVLLTAGPGHTADTHLWYEDRFGIIHAKLNHFALDSSKGDVCLLPYDASSWYQQYTVGDNTITNRHKPQLLLKVIPETSGGATVRSGPASNHGSERWVMRAV